MATKTKPPKLESPADGIEVRDIGPVRSLHLATPPEGGVVVLRGRNGSGKSTTLKAVETLAAGTGSLDVRDGAPDGEVAGYGAIVRVGRNTRHLGELEVTGLEGLSIADLVDPGLKDPAAADARRIKALVRLSGQQLDESAFAELFGSPDEARAILGDALDEISDPVEMAEKCKRTVEAAARAVERQAGAEESEAKAAASAVEGVNVAAASELDGRRGQYAWALGAECKVKAEREAGLRAERKAAEARVKIAEYEADRTGPSLAELAEQHAAANKSLMDASAEVRRLQMELAKAQRAFVNRNADLAGIVQAIEAENARVAAMAGWLEAADAKIECPSEADVDAASAVVAKARESVTEAEIAARSRDKKERADQLAAKAIATRREADRLREIAGSTDSILSGIVAGMAGVDLRIHGGRLVTTTGRSPDTLFGDLSPGERWRLSLDIAIEVVKAAALETGRPPLLVAPQEAWEGLDPTNRRAIAERLSGSGVVLITAEPSESSLHAEVFEGEPALASA